jgi:ABC-2 type transport system permease protein
VTATDAGPDPAGPVDPVTPPAAPAPVPLPVRARDVLASEWIKLLSVRSTYWTLLVAVVTPIGLSALVAVTLANAPGRGAHSVDPLLPGVISLEYALLAVGVMGVLTFSTEYSTGLIRTTFEAVPRRRAVLAAKAAVIGALTLVVGEVVAFASFGLVQAVLSGKHVGVSLSQRGVLGAVLADGLLLFVVATMGVGLGAIVRHTAGGIAALVGVIIVPAILALLPPPWGARVGRFTLLDAARQVTALHPATNLFAPAWSLVVLLAWPAVALLAAAVTITRRDA